jgi:hypothetical protein
MSRCVHAAWRALPKAAALAGAVAGLDGEGARDEGDAREGGAGRRSSKWQLAGSEAVLRGVSLIRHFRTDFWL